MLARWNASAGPAARRGLVQIGSLPDEFSAAGLMVPEPSMMPFPMPPFARAETGCDMEEYMPERNAAAARAALEGAPASGSGSQEAGDGERAQGMVAAGVAGACGAVLDDEPWRRGCWRCGRTLR